MIKEDFGMENIKVKDRFVDEKTGIEYIKKGGSSISTPHYNRNIRLARAFGDEYSVENIKARIYHYTTEIKQEKKYKVRIYDGVKIDSELLKKITFL